MLDAPIEARIKRLERKVRADKMMVAFVAEFSRGKSEMINAIFFAAYGRRIMPASAGRTTMCPTEIGYEPDVAACLRLLPIRTRLQVRSLSDWRLLPEAWDCTALDVQDPAQLARTLERVTDTLQVSPQEAQALGFWHSQTPQANPPLDAQGLVQIPKWRHALVNIAHPLLEQGLVILDTPGLNAMGAEPELTVGLIAQAHAVVFILGAETGVTQSDLGIWQHHIVNEPDHEGATLVVLNKIDTLWDELSTAEQVQEKINVQRVKTAQALGLATRQVLAVSAQKALIAKVSDNRELLAKSGITTLETALAQGMLGQRHQRLRAAVTDELTKLKLDINRAIQARTTDLAEQQAEMDAMQGKSRAVLLQMRRRISVEQQQFEAGCARFVAIKGVQAKLFQEIVFNLGYRSLEQEMLLLGAALAQRGLKLGAKKAYGVTFERLRSRLRSVQAIAQDIHAMHAATFAQINTEFGFSLHAAVPPALETYLTDLDLAEFSHTKYLGLRNLLRLQQAEFSQRLVQVLHARLKKLCESMVAELDLWCKSLVAALDAQIGMRRSSFAARIETVEKIAQFTDGIEERLGHMAARQKSVQDLAYRLAQQTDCLVAANEDALGQSDLALA